MTSAMTATFHTVAPFAAVLGLLLMALGLRISLMRLRRGTYLGDGGDKALMRAVRLHGNATEHVPILLILLFALAAVGAPAHWVAILGVATVTARVLHVAGNLIRVFLVSATGSGATYLLEGGMSLWLLVLVLGAP